MKTPATTHHPLAWLEGRPHRSPPRVADPSGWVRLELSVVPSPSVSHSICHGRQPWMHLASFSFPCILVLDKANGRLQACTTYGIHDARKRRIMGFGDCNLIL